MGVYVVVELQRQLERQKADFENYRRETLQQLKTTALNQKAANQPNANKSYSREIISLKQENKRLKENLKKHEQLIKDLQENLKKREFKSVCSKRHKEVEQHLSEQKENARQESARVRDHELKTANLETQQWFTSKRVEALERQSEYLEVRMDDMLPLSGLYYIAHFEDWFTDHIISKS